MKKLLAYIMVLTLIFGSVQAPMAALAEEAPDLYIAETYEEDSEEPPADVAEMIETGDEETVEEIAGVVAQPELSVSVTVDQSGETPVLHAESAEGAELIWQRSYIIDASFEDSWTEIARGEACGLSGQSLNDCAFRCVAVLGEMRAVSEIVILNAAESVEEREIPALQTEVASVRIECNEDETALHAVVEGTDETLGDYRWQIYVGGNWSNIDSSDGATLALPGIDRYRDYEYRCMVSAGEMLLVSDSFSFETLTERTEVGIEIPENLAIRPAYTRMNAMLGDTIDLGVTTEPAGYRLRYISDDPDVVSVADDGTLRAEGLGTCRVTAAVYGFENLCTDVEVTVSEIGYRIEFNLPGQTSLTLAKKQTVKTITATVYQRTPVGEYRSMTPVMWESSDPKIVTANASSGALKGIAEGSAVVTARIPTMPEVKASLQVKVVTKKTNLPSKITMSLPYTTVGVGSRLPVSVAFNGTASDGYVLSSNNAAIVSVTGDGYVVANAVGRAKITATTLGGRKHTITMTVMAAPAMMNLSENVLVLPMGDSAQLTTRINSGAAAYGTMTSSDEDVAVVSADGVVRAVGCGKAVITAETYNHLVDTCAVTVVEPLTELTLEAPRSTMGIKETLQLDAHSNLDEYPEVSPVKSYTSSNVKIATVSETGLVTAKKAGTVTITAKTYKNDITKSITLRVVNAPKSIALTADATVLGVGESTSLNVSLDAASAGAYSIVASNPAAVAFVNGNGGDLLVKETGKVEVMATQMGSVAFTAKSYNGRSSKPVTVQIMQAPERVDFEKKTLRLPKGDRYTLNASVNSGASSRLRYTSSNPDVATVDESGKVTAVNEGTAYLTVETYNGQTDTCELTVTAAIARMRVTTARGERPDLARGETLQAKVICYDADDEILEIDSVFTWNTANKKRATVSEAGLIKGVAYGTVVISAMAYNGKSNSMTVNVLNAPSSIKLAAQNTVIGYGDSTKLSVSFPAKAFGGCTFKSLNPELLSVDEDGTVTSVAGEAMPRMFGAARIQAVSFNGKTATIDITVVPAPTSAEFAKTNYTIAAGDRVPTKVVLSEGSAASIRYESDDESIATVNEDGVITALREGVAVINATTYNQLTTEATLTVTQPISALTIDAPRAQLGVGDSMQLKVNNDRQADTVYTFETSNKKVALVDENGIVTGKKKGTVTISATWTNTVTGKRITAKCNVSVVAAPGSVSIAASATRIGVGETTNLQPVFKAGQSGSVSWVSGMPEIASVDTLSGEVTGLAVGSVTIGVRTFNNKNATTMLTVAGAPEQLEWSCDGEPLQSLKLATGDTRALSARVLPSTAAGQIHYSVVIGSPCVAIGEDGMIRALSEGYAVIKAETYNDVFAMLEIEVLPAVTTVVIADECRTLLGIGETEALKVTNNLDFGISYKFASSNTKVVTVDAHGAVKACAAGTATVTATAYNGVKASKIFTVKAAPTTVKIEAPRTRVGLGETIALKYTYGSNQAGGCAWFSMNEDIVQIDAETGKLTGVALGTATIGVRTFNNKVAMTNIEVCPPIESVRFVEGNETVSSITLALNDSYKPQVEISPANAIGEITVTEVQTSGCIQIDANGTIRGVKNGHTTVRIRSNNGKTFDCAVEVREAQIRSLTLSSPTRTPGVGEQMQVRVTPDIDVKTNYTYKTSNAKVARVDANGVVAALTTGTVVITATAYNGVTGTLTLTVGKAPTQVYCSIVNGQKLGVGDTMQMNAYYNTGASGSIEVISMNESVASVSESGVITGLTPGVATITIRAYNGVQITKAIEVVPAPEYVRFGENILKIPVGATKTARAVLNEGTASAITYTGNNDSVATVSAEGVITAVGQGTMTLTASTYNHKTASITVQVVAAVKNITIAPIPGKLSVGNEQQLVISYEPVTDMDFDMEYESSNPNAVTVDRTGRIRAVGGGSATIKVKSYNGVTASVTVGVWYTPTRVQLSLANAYVDKGESTTVTVSFDSTNHYAEYTLSSSDPSVATITQSGELKVLGYGTTTLTCTTVNGLTTTLTLTFRDGQTQVNQLIAAAKTKLGCGYVYSAVGPDKFDCSGFVVWCFAQIGITIPHSSINISRSNWTTITDIANCQPGDILCFTGSDNKTVDHVGIYLGDNQMIHASQSQGKVIISDMDQFYWFPHFYNAKRVIQ